VVASDFPPHRSLRPPILGDLAGLCVYRILYVRELFTSLVTYRPAALRVASADGSSKQGVLKDPLPCFESLKQARPEQVRLAGAFHGDVRMT
jgi:hypothetical protein